MFGQVGEESQNIMARDFFDFVDTRCVPFSFLPDILRGFQGNDAEFGHGVAGMGFDLEPDAELYQQSRLQPFQVGNNEVS